MSAIPSENLLHVYKTGRMTVIGFDAKHLGDPQSADTILNRLLSMIEVHECEILVVDLMEVSIVSSWILGVLAAIQRQGVAIELYHPSPALADVLDCTNLSSLLHVRGTAQQE